MSSVSLSCFFFFFIKASICFLWYWHWWQELWNFYGIKNVDFVKTSWSILLWWNKITHKILVISPTPSFSYHCYAGDTVLVLSKVPTVIPFGTEILKTSISRQALSAVEQILKQRWLVIVFTCSTDTSVTGFNDHHFTLFTKRSHRNTWEEVES